MAEDKGIDPTFSVADSEQENTEAVATLTHQESWVEKLENEYYGASPQKTVFAMVSGFAMVCAFTVLYLALFTRMDTTFFSGTFVGYGDVVFIGLKGKYELGVYCGAGACFGFVILYVLDIYNWKGTIQGPLGKFLLMCCLVAFFVAVLLVADSYHSAPLIAFMLLSTSSVAFVKRSLFPDVNKLAWIKAVSGGLFFCSIGVGLVWVLWVYYEEKYWDTEVKIEYYDLLECENIYPNATFQELLVNETLLEGFISDGEPFTDCDAAYVVWAAPLIYFGITIALAITSVFVLRAERKRIESKAAVEVEPMAQVFVTLILLTVFGMWVAASIASATSAVSDTILSMSLLSLVTMVGIAAGVFGLSYVRSQVKKTSMGKKAYEFGTSDWGKAFVTVLLGPLLVAFLGLDMITQFIRKHTGLGKTIIDEEEMTSVFTKGTRRRLIEMSQWEFGSVCTKGLIWGMFFFTVSVGVARIVLVFLSWLREELVTVPVSSTVGIIIAVGIIMFLLPPVPGVPVYITIGIVLVSKMEEEFGFVLSIFLGILLSLGLKIAAIFMQQKIIGEMFGAKSVTIRSMVGINSVEIRAIRRALMEPRPSFGKVAILIGAPDWPISVLTGIMRLPYFKMAFYSLPVVFLIAPCVISGALLVKASAEGGIYDSLNSLFVTVTVVVQSGSMVVAAQTIAKYSVKYAEQLRAEDPDVEVLELEKKKEHKVALSKELASWKNLNTAFRCAHVVSVLLMTATCWMFQLIGSSLFVTFDITDSIDEDLDGNVANLVQPAGRYVLLAFFCAAMWYFVFRIILSRRVKAKLQQENNTT
mmetsp:Transcript_12454/g.14314  ORF Transcript_12454/g.14314 Transcript_12454/m.14314 type:complete len:813 (+) Transcript_12454:168-2606(+)|eukprot:CAMPEP_0184016002 /NCGR_PEP_ID=MMETSP0954-20121128/6671_1 /TAXON_ID=627963 /ORGANISM="Aplanochytrium sp, Strain PBS07" /LENGTH=812 /DNA_ID=CAMNT_0026296943 /DNA_START=261 /DNA_END=2699 /DNA_ORIENTATION=+